jgi:hypothetical protein
MRRLLTVLVLSLSLAADAGAADPPKVPAAPEDAPVQLGADIVLPRAVYAELAARPDGWAIIERMQQRAETAHAFEGVPHLIAIFVSVLLFFWSAMFYYNRKHARLHRTIQLMVEKGQPLPVEILRAAEQLDASGESAKPAAPHWASNLMWGGVLWITVGITACLYLWSRGSDAWPWGLAAIVYGVAAAGTAYWKRDPR